MARLQGQCGEGIVTLPPAARADGQGLRFDEVKEERGERATKFLRAIKMRLY